jgi:hypothetical protein
MTVKTGMVSVKPNSWKVDALERQFRLAAAS